MQGSITPISVHPSCLSCPVVKAHVHGGLRDHSHTCVRFFHAAAVPPADNAAQAMVPRPASGDMGPPAAPHMSRLEVIARNQEMRNAGRRMKRDDIDPMDPVRRTHHSYTVT